MAKYVLKNNFGFKRSVEFYTIAAPEPDLYKNEVIEGTYNAEKNFVSLNDFDDYNWNGIFRINEISIEYLEPYSGETVRVNGRNWKKGYEPEAKPTLTKQKDKIEDFKQKISLSKFKFWNVVLVIAALIAIYFVYKKYLK